MKYSNIYKKVLGLALAALTIAACSDKWDEHYDAPLAGGSNMSLWEAISADPQLSNFARVVEACGYDASLKSSQVFTVFAPTNDNFPSSEADRLIAEYNQQAADNSIKEEDNSVIKEFVRNHIALYNHSVATSSSDSILMMNGKILVLSSDNMAGQKFVSSNTLHNNGVLFTLDGKIEYQPNVFEYLRKDADLDSLANFLYEHNHYEFDASQSVPGDIVDGKTVYLDSVTVLENSLFSYLGKINSEDSTYWMVAPTNDVWNELVAEYEPYFVYDASVADRDSMMHTNPRLMTVIGSVFSRTFNPDAQIRDSVVSTQYVPYKYRSAILGFYDVPYCMYERPFEPGGVFYGTENHECSNGQVMKASEWNFDKYRTFCQINLIEGESRTALKEIGYVMNKDSSITYTTTSNIIEVDPSNPFYNKISGNSYLELAPTASSNPSATFNVYDVLSNLGYDIDIVMAPALAGDTLASESSRIPCKMRATIYYYDGATGRDRQLGQFNFETPADQCDEVATIHIAEDFKFDYCSFGVTTPLVTILIESRASNAEVRNGQYTRTMRIDNIVLRPHQEDSGETN